MPKAEIAQVKSEEAVKPPNEVKPRATSSVLDQLFDNLGVTISSGSNP